MDKVERVARAICAARGDDPDSDSGRGPMVSVTKRHSAMSSSSSLERQELPNWRLCETEARVFIAAQAALAADLAEAAPG